MTKYLSENTKVTISLMLTILGGTFWLSKIYFLSESNAATLEKVEVKQDSYSSDIRAIRESIVKIEAEMSHLNKTIRR